MRYRKLLLTALFVILGFNVQNFAQPNNPISTNQNEGLTFDEEEIFVPCPGVKSYLYFTTDELLGVNVKTTEQPEKLKFNYSVSGGRIVGTGANVNWDLKNARIGKYKIGVNVRGKNFRRKFFKEIQIKKPSACDPPCSCPSLSIINSESVQDGKTVVFTAQTRGGSQSLVTYKWTLSEGRIIKGQGTSKIKVKTDGLKGKTITATVEIGGDLCVECARTTSSSVEIN